MSSMKSDRRCDQSCESEGVGYFKRNMIRLYLDFEEQLPQVLEGIYDMMLYYTNMM